MASKTATTSTPRARRTSAASPTPPKTPVKRARPAPSASKGTTVVSSQAPIPEAPDLRKKELIDAVVSRSGIKKKDAKPVIEAMLMVMGEALAEGREFNLPDFGKLKINRTKNVSGAKVIVNRIRQPEASATKDDEALADTAE